MKKILLLDIENLPKTEKDLLKYLSQYQYVYLVYAKSPINFSLDGVVKLAPFIMNGRLKVLKMPKVGKDAADFGLTFIAGQLSTQFKPKEISFDVMSNDRSMEYVADLLKIAQFEAKILHEKPLLPLTLIKEIKEEQDIISLVNKYCENLKRNNFSKPAKVDTLVNSLKVNLKIEEEIAKVVIEELKKYKIIKIDQLKVEYINVSLDRYLKMISAETAQLFDSEIERKITNLRLRLMPYLNVAPHVRPQYLSGFIVLLERFLPKNQVDEALLLLEKFELISIQNRKVTYSPVLLGS